MEELENHHPDPNGQQLDAVMAKAHIVVDSNCSMEEFARRVESCIDALEKKNVSPGL